ncbi:MAG: ABC transporter ATP-binding protein [Proteobacteria bacterium]|nr:MAG: ABC transporter ATP-binding protein [Pseudomonadota bacterium]
MAEAVQYSIDIVSLSKRFKRQTIRRGGYSTVKSSILNLLRRFTGVSRAPPLNFTYAVKDLTMRVPKGTSMGIIGRNGSGKSSLLKLITGIYKPERGTVRVNGRVAALIELGAGFHPDFSGRENLFLSGVMHGLTKKEIQSRFDQIVSFAELEDVIDDPVRTYSSGMYMRLGFSLAVHTDPDVLLVDEVLAVGDEAFVSKCRDRISELRKEGKTLLIVSHDLPAIERWCDEAIWLDKGEVKDRGDPRRVIDRYREFLERGEEASLKRENEEIESVKEEPITPEGSEPHQPQRWGSREVEITSIETGASTDQRHFVLHSEDQLSIKIRYTVHASASIPADEIVFGVCIRRSDGLTVFGTNTDIERISSPTLTQGGEVGCRFARLGLLEGSYLLDVAVHRRDGYPYDYHQGAVRFVVRSPKKRIGVFAPELEWEFPQIADTKRAANVP